MSRNLNHFQKVYCSLIANQLKILALPEAQEDYTELVETALEKMPGSGIACTPDSDEDFERRFCEKLVASLKAENYAEMLLNAVIGTKDLAVKAIKEAPYMIASDFNEASEIVIAFVKDDNRFDLMLGADSGHCAASYAFLKLRYNERITLLYGSQYSSYNAPPGSIEGMKYLGFYSRSTGMAYSLKEPLDGMYWFDRKDHPLSESDSELKKSLGKAIQQEVAGCVSKNASESSDIAVPTRELLEQAELAYSKGITTLSFAEKIVLPSWYTKEEHLIRFIDGRDVLIAELTDRYMNTCGNELEARWIAHCAAQKLLDQIRTVATGAPDA